MKIAGISAGSQSLRFSRFMCAAVILALASAAGAQQAATPVTGKPAAAGGGSLAVLAPPLTVKGAPVTGKGEGRKSTVTIINSGSKAVKGYVLNMLFMTTAGKVGKSVPHTHGGSFSSEGSVLKAGRTYVQEIDSFFMEDDTASMGGVITGVTFEDNSEWPATPAKPPQNGSDPVSVFLMGMIGTGEQAVPTVACFNYSTKNIKSIYYNIQYLDAGGKVLDESSYGSMSDASILDAGKGTVISGGNCPPAGAVSAKVVVSEVEFADGSKWAPGK